MQKEKTHFGRTSLEQAVAIIQEVMSCDRGSNIGPTRQHEIHCCLTHHKESQASVLSFFRWPGWPVPAASKERARRWGRKKREEKEGAGEEEERGERTHREIQRKIQRDRERDLGRDVFHHHFQLRELGDQRTKMAFNEHSLYNTHQTHLRNERKTERQKERERGEREKARARARESSDF